MSEKKGSFVLAALAFVLLAGILLFQVYDTPPLYPEPSTGANINQTVNATTPSSAESVNLNTASMEELMTLDGVGEAKAQAIIEYRDRYGGFATIDEFLNVKGIGEAILEKNRNRLAV